MVFKADSDIELDDDATNHFNAGTLEFGTWQIVLPAGVNDVTSLFKNKATNISVTGFGSTAQAVTQGQQTVGANTAEFNWTFAKHNNAF